MSFHQILIFILIKSDYIKATKSCFKWIFTKFFKILEKNDFLLFFKKITLKLFKSKFPKKYSDSTIPVKITWIFQKKYFFGLLGLSKMSKGVSKKNGF